MIDNAAAQQIRIGRSLAVSKNRIVRGFAKKAILSSLATSTRTWWKTVDELTEEIGATRSAVWEHLTWLVEQGFVEVLRRRARGRVAANYYRMTDKIYEGVELRTASRIRTQKEEKRRPDGADSSASEIRTQSESEIQTQTPPFCVRNPDSLSLVLIKTPALNTPPPLNPPGNQEEEIGQKRLEEIKALATIFVRSMGGAVSASQKQLADFAFNWEMAGRSVSFDELKARIERLATNPFTRVNFRGINRIWSMPQAENEGRTLQRQVMGDLAANPGREWAFFQQHAGYEWLHGPTFVEWGRKKYPEYFMCGPHLLLDEEFEAYRERGWITEDSFDALARRNPHLDAKKVLAWARTEYPEIFGPKPVDPVEQEEREAEEWRDKVFHEEPVIFSGDIEPDIDNNDAVLRTRRYLGADMVNELLAC